MNRSEQKIRELEDRIAELERRLADNSLPSAPEVPRHLLFNIAEGVSWRDISAFLFAYLLFDDGGSSCANHGFGMKKSKQWWFQWNSSRNYRQ